MAVSVLRLKPRRGSFENALDAFASGNFELSIEMLSEDRSAPALALVARAHLRSGDFLRALEALDACESSNLSHQAVAEILVIRTTALFASRRFDDARDAVVEARVRCISLGMAEIEAELLLAQAIGAILCADYDSAESTIRSILDLADSRPPWSATKNYPYSLHYWRARALEILGVVEHARGSFERQAQAFQLAFNEFDLAGNRDDFFEVALLANFADAAIGTGSMDVVRFAIERSERITWTTALTAMEYRVFSAIAQGLSLNGDQLGALRYFRRCLNCAPTIPLQIRACVERAKLLGEVGETFSAREEIDHALRLSFRVDWQNVSPGDRRQLVFLATQVAIFDAKEATRLLERFDKLDDRLSHQIALKDMRFAGELLVARAAVALANGSSDRAILCSIDALGAFTEAGYASLAAGVAADLAIATNEPHYATIALQQCERHPQSLLARKMANFRPVVHRSSESVMTSPRKRILTLV